MKIFFMLFTLIVCCPVLSQVKDSALVGSCQGTTFDSSHNHALRQATIAIYKIEDSALIKYGLSDNFGEFAYNNLPIETGLYIVVSYTGYITYKRAFSISKKEENYKFNRINLKYGKEFLDEVVVSYIPPVRMNGDTLEFNASAFKLDKNAVAEDLLRKLPGVTIWGDGVVTVNGRKVNSLLVDGKPFFGGDLRIATQNIPKNAIDKVQVYQQNRDNSNTVDSVTQVNIKLKEGMHSGIFGKISTGLGTRSHYESDVSINYFTKTSQIGVVGALNDINKVASDVTILMRNSTYKGVGANIEYQPDFSMPGLNRGIYSGFTFQQDLAEKSKSNYRNSGLAIDYFFSNNRQESLNRSQTITSVGGDTTITRADSTSNYAVKSFHDFKSKYNANWRNYKLELSANMQLSRNDNTLNTWQNSISNKEGLQSVNFITNNVNSRETRGELQASLLHSKEYNNNVKPGDWAINYKLSTFSNSNDNSFVSIFNSSALSANSQKIDRNYIIESNNLNQTLSAKLGNLSNILFGAGNFISTIKVEIQNDLDLNTQNQNRLVRDRDTSSNNIYIKNPYLTNKSKYVNINENPSINLSKVFVRKLADRFDKSFLISSSLRGQYYYQNNESSHSFQIFSRDYFRFTPGVIANYTNNQYGFRKEVLLLNFNISSAYPTVDQLYPLVDSSNLYFIQEGNPRLEPTRRKQTSLTFQHTSLRAKNPFNYEFNGSFGVINNAFGDSVIVNESGMFRHYTINIKEQKFLILNGLLNKSFKASTNSVIQLMLTNNLTFRRNPNYILNDDSHTNVLTVSNTTSDFSKLSVLYSYKDLLVVNLAHSLSYYNSIQGSSNTRFENITNNSIVSSSVNCTKRLTLKSNISYTNFSTKGSFSTHFAIWNASASYRFLKDNNLEMKLSVLDLLKQNKSIYNLGDSYSVVYGSTNVLQQYFMITLSYFPRKFGKKMKDSDN